MLTDQQQIALQLLIASIQIDGLNARCIRKETIEDVNEIAALFLEVTTKPDDYNPPSITRSLDMIATRLSWLGAINDNLEKNTVNVNPENA